MLLNNIVKLVNHSIIMSMEVLLIIPSGQGAKCFSRYAFAYKYID